MNGKINAKVFQCYNLWPDIKIIHSTLYSADWNQSPQISLLEYISIRDNFNFIRLIEFHIGDSFLISKHILCSGKIGRNSIWRREIGLNAMTKWKSANHRRRSFHFIMTYNFAVTLIQNSEPFGRYDSGTTTSPQIKSQHWFLLLITIISSHSKTSKLSLDKVCLNTERVYWSMWCKQQFCPQ